MSKTQTADAPHLNSACPSARRVRKFSHSRFAGRSCFAADRLGPPVQRVSRCQQPTGRFIKQPVAIQSVPTADQMRGARRRAALVAEGAVTSLSASRRRASRSASAFAAGGREPAQDSPCAVLPFAGRAPSSHPTSPGGLGLTPLPGRARISLQIACDRIYAPTRTDTLTPATYSINARAPRLASGGSGRTTSPPFS
jgi:hypothetical protein